MRAGRDLRTAGAGVLAVVIAFCVAPVSAGAQAPSSLSAHRVNDAIAGGRLGAVVAGARGYRTEFDFNGRIVPRKAIPPNRPKFTNRYTFGGGNRAASDETYVEIPLIEALRSHGLQADSPQLREPL